METTEVLNKQYQNISLLCYQLTHFISDFDNEFQSRNESDRLIKDSIKELLKTLQDDAFTSAELIYEILDAEDYGKGFV
ncbi:MAG: hypothetical protein LC122_09595 [Chitinophagales bacterium]|nr:hypothetical protein [Chitinophagales bacterium]